MTDHADWASPIIIKQDSIIFKVMDKNSRFCGVIFSMDSTTLVPKTDKNGITKIPYEYNYDSDQLKDKRAFEKELEAFLLSLIRLEMAREEKQVNKFVQAFTDIKNKITGSEK